MKIRDKIREIAKKIWQDGDFRTLSLNSAAILVLKVLGAALAFLVQIPVTRLLGAENYGVYVYVLSWVMLAGILTRFGMDMTFVKHLSLYISEKKWASLKGILTFGFRGALIACLLLTIVVYMCLYLFSLQTSSFSSYVFVGAAFLFILTVFQLTKEALRGLKLVLFSEIIDSIVRPLLLLTFFLFFFYVCVVQDASAVLWGNVLATLIVTIILSIHLWRKLPAPVKQAKPDFSDRAAWLSLALPMILMGGMGVLLARTDIIMLGTMTGTAEAGVYAIGSRFADLTTFGLIAVNSMLAPQIAEMYHSGQKERLQRLLKIAAWFVFIFTFGVALVLSLLGPFLLSLFGEEFEAAYSPMLILLGGQMVNALAGPIGLLMTMTGRQKEVAKVLFITVILNTIGNLVFIPYYGMNGAAISTGFSVGFVIIVLFLHIIKDMKLNPSILPIKSTVKHGT